jgi:putative ABC transport system permease protein
MSFKSNFKAALHNLPRHGQHNLAKILCLALGLALSSVLIAEVCYEQSYDRSIPDYDRTYLVSEKVVQNGELGEYSQTSGATVMGIKAFAPQVEAATRFTYQLRNSLFTTDDNHRVEDNLTFADSCFFDIFPTDIIAGKPEQVLAQPLYCMVPRSLADKLGGNVVGQHLRNIELPGLTLVIGGVYDDYARNTTVHDVGILLSMNTMRLFAYDGSRNWVGNDRYRSFVRLKSGHRPDEIRPGIARMIREKLPLKDLQKAGVKMDYTLMPMAEEYTHDGYIHTMGWVLTILAAIMLFSAVMNYLLIVIGNMMNRTREMAVRKSFGAGKRSIVGLIFTEATLHVVLAVVLASLLVWACKGSIEQFLSAPISELVMNKGSWILLLVLAVVLLIGGLLPGLVYSSIPVTVAFRGYAQHHRRWKLGLLSFEFVAVALMCCLLLTVNRQYAMMINRPLGYNPEGQAIVKVGSNLAADYDKCVAEIRRMPGVEGVTMASNDLVSSRSGNNIMLPGEDRNLFNVQDLYSVSDGYLRQMGIRILQGRNFTEQTDSLREVMVSRSFIDKMKTTAHWGSDIVGKRIVISEHSLHENETFTIVGVFDEIKTGSANWTDDRPLILFYNRHPQGYIIVRFHEMTTEQVEEVRTRLTRLLPGVRITMQTYPQLLRDQYRTQNSFRMGVLVCGIAIMFIALLGLVGYTLDEVGRRRKEIAIRKVNGAQLGDILRIFVRDISVIAVPSLVVGAITAYVLATIWLKQFSERISPSPWLYLLCIVTILLFIIGMVVWNSRKVAHSNPVEYLKDE